MFATVDIGILLSRARSDFREQFHLIQQHWKKLCEERKRNVSPEFAAQDWVEKHAADWRRSHETR